MACTLFSYVEVNNLPLYFIEKYHAALCKFCKQIYLWKTVCLFVMMYQNAIFLFIVMYQCAIFLLNSG